MLSVTGDKAVGDVLGRALAAEAQVVEVVPHRETLEDLFMRRAIQAPESAGSARPPAAASGE